MDLALLEYIVFIVNRYLFDILNGIASIFGIDIAIF